MLIYFFDITRWKSGITTEIFVTNMVHVCSNEGGVNDKLCMHCYISPSSECLFKYLNESYTLLYVNKYVLRLSSWIFLWEKKSQIYVILWQMSLSYVLIHSMYFISYFRFFTSRHYLVNISCTCCVWRNNFHTYHAQKK